MDAVNGDVLNGYSDEEAPLRPSSPHSFLIPHCHRRLKGKIVRIIYSKNAALSGSVWSLEFRQVIIAFLTISGIVMVSDGCPLTLAYSTYLGGSRNDFIRGITTDSQGNIYRTGYTASSDFPTTPGAYDRKFHGWYDIFVVKLDPNGQLVWSTLLGGPGYDLALAIEVDRQGYVYIAGAAGPGAPVTPSAFQTNYNGYYTGKVYGNQNAYLAKLKPDGSGLVWASYFGATELIRDLAIDPNGDLYVLTNAQSVETGTWPSAWFAQAFQPTRNGPSDAMAAKIR